MNIQSSINQSISLAGLLWSQTPYAAAQRDKMAQKQKVKDNEKAINEYEMMAEYGAIPETEAETAVQLEIAKRGQAALKEQFALKPSEETYNQYMYAESYMQELEGIRNKLSREQAKHRAAQALEDEVGRIEESNALTNMYDLSKIDERAMPRLERAIKRAERDTKYLNKKEGTE